MIYNIRGTSGSGKTHLARSLVNSVDPAIIFQEGSQKIFGYVITPTSQRGLLVLGRYDDGIKGGGVDNITGALHKRFLADGLEGNSMDAVQHEVLNWYLEGYHVLFEGLIVTSVWGRWRKIAEEIPFHFLFLDTPLEVCYQRVLERSGGRSPKGWAEGKSDLHAKHGGTEKQMASIQRRDGEVKRQQSSLEDFHGRQTKRHIPAAQDGNLRYTLLDHTQAYTQLREILTAEIDFPEV